MSDPGPYNAITDEYFFGSIGRLTISWGLCEAGLTFAVSLLFHQFGGSALEPEMPQNLKRRLRFVRDCVNKMDRLASVKAEALAITDEMSRQSELRHDLIHGIVTEHADGSTSDVKMVRFLRSNDHLLVERSFSVNTTTILKAATDANKLGKRTLALAQSLIDLDGTR